MRHEDTSSSFEEPALFLGRSSYISNSQEFVSSPPVIPQLAVVTASQLVGSLESLPEADIHLLSSG